MQDPFHADILSSHLRRPIVKNTFVTALNFGEIINIAFQ